jgi:hypothetical protein
VAGLRPGFGLGGITHSLLVREDGVVTLLCGGDAGEGEGLMHKDGRLPFCAIGGGDAIIICQVIKWV